VVSLVETIYVSLFVQSRGALRRELTGYLRRRHATRHPRGVSTINGQGQLRDTINIRERPAEADDRAVPVIGKATCPTARG
jgi:transposase, IS30 family